jgi:hypothetical protein
MRRLALPLALALLAALCSGGGSGPAFGGFVGSAQTTVSASVDSLDQHLTVSVPPSGGQLDVHNPTAVAQSVALVMVDPSDGSVGGRFKSTGGDHATIAGGASDTVELLDSSSNPAAGKVALGIARPDGALFPSRAYAVPAPGS